MQEFLNDSPCFGIKFTESDVILHGIAFWKWWVVVKQDSRT